MMGFRALAVVALSAGSVLAPGPSPGALAATITADGARCTLTNAILTANTNTSRGGCLLVGPGRVDHTIVLTADVALTAVDDSVDEHEIAEHGPSGLPPINGLITINGNGHTIERDPALFAPAAGGDGVDPCSGTGAKFRIFRTEYPAGRLTLNDLTVRNGCVPTGYGGGGILHDGLNLTLNRVMLHNNKASLGGGVYSNETTTTINDSMLAQNSAQSGGGIFHRYGTVNIVRSTLVRNAATGGSGTVCVTYEYVVSCLPAGAGGGSALKAGATNVTDSTIKENSAATNGGGVYNTEIGTTVLIRSTVAQNSAGSHGGGIFVDAGTVNVTSATIAQNSAGGDGGGIFSSGGATKVTSATIAQNSAGGHGGGIFTKRRADKQVTLKNTLLDNAVGGNCVVDGTALASVGYNLATDGSCKLSSAHDQQNVADPKLGAYTDDGTPAHGHVPLLAGSPAIDAGTNAQCPAADQIGESRVGICDIGASEYPRRVKVWIGLKDGPDIGLRVDLRAEMFVNGTLAGQGQLDNVWAGGTGFSNAILFSISVAAVNVSVGVLELTVSARRACSGAGRNSGTVRLWYNGNDVDSGPGRDASSRVGATHSGNTKDFFLRDSFALDSTAGSSRFFIDEFVDSSAACSGSGRPFTPFGTWSIPAP